MADPVQDFINFNWKLRQDVARVDNYKQATAQVCTGQWAEAVAQWRSAGGGEVSWALLNLKQMS